MKNSGFSLTALANKLLSGIIQAFNGIFRVAIDTARSMFNDAVKNGLYDFDDELKVAKKEYRTNSSLQRWFRGYYDKHEYKTVLIQGHLYMFDYPDPLTKDTLSFFDTSPLVLSFGLYFAKTNNTIEYAVNLHMLPQKIRELFLTDIFNLYKFQYKGVMYSDKPRKINEFTWEQLKVFIDKYHIDFAVRSYIPERRFNTVCFDYQDWPKAILLPTRGMVGVTERELIDMYKNYVKIRK